MTASAKRFRACIRDESTIHLFDEDIDDVSNPVSKAPEKKIQINILFFRAYRDYLN